MSRDWRKVPLGAIPICNTIPNGFVMVKFQYIKEAIAEIEQLLVENEEVLTENRLLTMDKAELVEALDNLTSNICNGVECFEEPDTPAGYLGNAVSPESTDVQTATDLLERLSVKLEGGEPNAKS